MAPFPGKCGRCRKKGHKAADCPEKRTTSTPRGDAAEAKSDGAAARNPENGNGASLMNRSCCRCKQKGHFVKDCPLRVNAMPTRGEKIRLCMDAGSTVGIASSRKGMYNIEKCRHLVESADKEQGPIVVTEKGCRKLKVNSASLTISLSLPDTYIVESCPKDICSLSQLINCGTVVANGFQLTVA